MHESVTASDFIGIKGNYEFYRVPIDLFCGGKFRGCIVIILFVLLTALPRVVWPETIGEIRPKSGSASYKTYIWNGKTVKARSGSTCKTTWSFDGKKLKKQCGAVASDTYLWDGTTFGSLAGATNDNTWAWDGKELKREVGSTARDTWVFDGRCWSLKVGATSRTSWEISGFVPIPVCILLILGLSS